MRSACVVRCVYACMIQYACVCVVWAVVTVFVSIGVACARVMMASLVYMHAWLCLCIVVYVSASHPICMFGCQPDFPYVCIADSVNVWVYACMQ